MNTKVKIGLLQMQSGADSAKNLKKAEQKIGELANKGAQIVCLPELFASEYFCQIQDKKYFDFAEPIPDGPTTQFLCRMAKAYAVSIITSVYEKAPSGKFFNTAVVIEAGGNMAGIYRKMHIPYDPEHHYDEGFYFSAGDLGYKSIKVSGVAVGPMICYDQWFPEGARESAKKGAQILFYPTAIGWPSGQREDLNKAEHEAWQVMHRSHAIANNVFVVAVNRVGQDQHLRFWGTSMVADPYGCVIARAPHDAEANLAVECDLSVIETMRKDWPFLRDVEREEAARKNI